MERGTIQCSRCGHENPPGSKFCAQCGNDLAIICPVCSTPAQPDAKFCSNCGNALAAGVPAAATAQDDLARYVPEELLAKIRAARAGHAMRGERRTVTMLFADIEGSTAAAEGMDPEDWAEIINGAFQHLIGPVYRYEGTLARLAGDAVLAFFGAPIAHEDDPVRAVRAGLEIVAGVGPYRDEVEERRGVPIDVRVGINTGLVVVGEVGSDLRVEYTAMGDAINVAARMEQTAEPGTVRITAETWRLVSELFDADEIGPVDVKGKTAPVIAYQALRFTGRPAGPRYEGALVGRTEELATLERLRDQLEQGGGWIASVMGDAGVGKSRLVDEFRQRTQDATSVAFAHEEPGDIAWMAAASRSYDSAVPHATLRDLLLRWWRLDDSDDPYATIQAVVDEVGLDDFEDVAVYLAHVADVPVPAEAETLLSQLEPPALHGRSREAVARYLAAEAGRRPVLVSLEDLHWADSMSLTIVDDLMGIAADMAPLGLLVSMRPYRDEPTWHIHEVAQRDHPHRYEYMALESLEVAAAEELLDALAGEQQLDEATRARILERADGNPLFVEQMVRAIQEGETNGQVAVPSGLMALLTSRLDRLHDESKLVAQFASVIGSQFDRETLETLVGAEVAFGERVTDLLRRGMFVELERGPRGVLGFHHALVQEAAYSTVLLRTRRELHHRVAEHMSVATPDSVQEIARHFVEAGAVDAAFPFLVEAGFRTTRSMALSDAIRFFSTALEHFPEDADSELIVKAHDGLGAAYSLVPDLTQSGAAYQRLYDYGEQADRPSAKVTALNRLALTSATLAGDLPAAQGYLQDALQLATEIGDEAGLAEYHMNACFISSMGGRMDVAVEHDAEIARLGGEQGVDEIRIEGLVRRAVNATALMDFEQAAPALEDALAAATEGGAELHVAIATALAASRHAYRRGDVAESLRLVEEHAPVLERYASFYAPIATVLAGSMLYDLGDVEAALSSFAAARRFGENAGLGAFVAVAAAAQARIYASVGMGDALDDFRAAALEPLGIPMGDFQANTVWTELALANLAQGRLDDAAADFATGLAASSTTQFWERPRLLIGRARALAGLGDLEEAHRLLDQAQAYVLEREAQVFYPPLAHARGVVLLAEGRADDAAAKLAEARQEADDLGLRTLRVEVLTAAARAALALDAAGEAAELAGAARSDVEELAAKVVDEQLRSAMLTAWLAPVDEITAAGR